MNIVIETASREQLQEAVRHLLEREEAQIAALISASAIMLNLWQDDTANISGYELQLLSAIQKVDACLGITEKESQS